MSDDFQSHTGIEWQGNVGVAQYGGGDKGQVVMFFKKAVQNPAKSAQAGRPQFETKIFVRVHPPGERLNIVEREVTPNDKLRWPGQWQQFSENKQQIPDGTPIELMYPELPHIAAMLRANGVHTVEVLAELSGHAIDNIGMGAQQYVNDAVKYLDMSVKGAGLTKIRAEMAEKDRTIKSLQHQIDLFKEELARVQEQLRTNSSIMAHAMAAGNMPVPAMPPAGTPMSKVFDPQAAMISANHPTAHIAQQKRAGTQAKPARKRARLTT